MRSSPTAAIDQRVLVKHVEAVRPVVMGGVRPLLQLLDQRHMIRAEADQTRRDRRLLQGIDLR